MTRIAVVTGANKGIGLAIVKRLAPQFDGLVYLTARNEELGQKALNELKAQNLTNVRYHQLDIDSQESINTFATYLKDTCQGLDVLINNASIQLDERSSKPFGEKAEETMRVNFLGTLNLCDALFPLLKTNARVVNVSSRAGLLKVIRDEGLRHRISSSDAKIQDVVDVMNLFVKAAHEGNLESAGFPSSEKAAYGISKAGQIAMTRIHQRILDENARPDVLVNSCTPGYVATDMTSHLGTLTPEQGAETPVHLAMIPEGATEPRGEFWAEMKSFDWFDKDFPIII